MSEKEKTLRFIEDYRSYEILWDIRRKDYTNKLKRNDAINELARKYEMAPKEVKNKIKSLRSYFSKEHVKVNKKKSGSGADETYETTWFGYHPLMFIQDAITPRKTKDTNNKGDSVNDIPGTSDETIGNDNSLMVTTFFIYLL